MAGSFFVKYLEEFIKVYIIYKYFFQFEVYKNKLWIIMMHVVSGIISLILILMGGIDKFYIETGFILVIYAFTLFSFQEKLWKKIIIYFPVYTGICLIDMMVDCFRKLVWGKLPFEESDMLISLIFNGIGIGIIIFLCYIKRMLKKDNRSIFGTWQMATLMSMIVVITAFFVAYASVILSYEDTTLNRVLYVVFTFVWLLFVILSYIFLHSIWAKEKYKLRIHMNENLLSQQQEYYQGLLEKDEKMRRFRHDYKGHLVVITDMMEQQKYDKVKEYLNNMKEVTEYLQVYQTGNNTIDIVLNDIASRFKDEGIQFKIKGRFTEQLELNQYDICTIFSNALKNAFEAVQRSQVTEKTIQMEINRQHNRWLIEIKNSVSTVIPIKNDKIETTKEDKHIHGFGIKNMKECIEKNNGMLRLTQKDNLFSTKIII